MTIRTSLFLLITIVFIVLVGCNKAEVKVSTEAQGMANSIAETNKNTDIFMFFDRVYQIVSSESDVDDMVEGKVGEIHEEYLPGDTFKNGMATILPIGTEIYATSIGRGYHFLLVNIDGKWIKYEALPQG